MQNHFYVTLLQFALHLLQQVESRLFLSLHMWFDNFSLCFFHKLKEKLGNVCMCGNVRCNYKQKAVKWQ